MSLLARLCSIMLGAALVPAGAFLLFALVFAATGEAPAALVLPPPAGGPGSLPEDVRVLSWSRGFAVVRSESRDYVRRLYGHGALLVLPVRGSGCLALAGSPRR
jgi:hypothetical protein